jgi:hypothetical protein
MLETACFTHARRKFFALADAEDAARSARAWPDQRKMLHDLKLLKGLPRTGGNRGTFARLGNRYESLAIWRTKW